MRSTLSPVLPSSRGITQAQTQNAPAVYRGACDGSAAVALDDGHFIAANDEDNTLRIYRIGMPDPVDTLDLNPVLKPETKKSGKPKEVDIEGAARVGDRIYWIASHSRDKNAKKESSRHRFFATDISRIGGAPPFILKPTQPYHDLLNELINQLPGLKLKDSSKLAPEDANGFNIEGLAATPDGGLIIGLRNPRPKGKAIAIPLSNPAAVLDNGAAPEFGKPEHLDLDNRGFRSIALMGGRYVIVAGPFGDDDHDFALYTWSGPGGPTPCRVSVALGEIKPEAVFATVNPNEVYLLSDDGTEACKDLADHNQKTFRGVAIKLAN
jgi:Protein of unknown function (DUF3616)